jgi:hypothetical protein
MFSLYVLYVFVRTRTRESKRFVTLDEAIFLEVCATLCNAWVLSQSWKENNAEHLRGFDDDECLEESRCPCDHNDQKLLGSVQSAVDVV